MDIKPQSRPFVNSQFIYFSDKSLISFGQVDNFHSTKEKHLTFGCGHVRVCTAIKKAVTKTVWLLLLQRVVGWCETMERLPETHHF